MLVALGNKLKNLRENKDLKQTQVAEFLHISQQNYSRYENGQVELPLGTLVQLADYFDVSVDYLLGRSKDTYAEPMILDRSVQDVIDNINKLNKDEKKSLFDFLDFLSHK